LLLSKACAIFFRVSGPNVQFRAVSEENSRRRLLLQAAIVSLLVHAVLFGGWKIGQRYGWWRQLHIPKFLSFLLPDPPKPPPKNPKLELPQKPKLVEVPLVFVDVDPAKTAPEPPKDTPYYGAANSTAANPTPTQDLDKPRVEGKDVPVVKVTPAGRPQTQAQPLQPSPKEPDLEDREPVPPKKAPEKILPGDLALVKPSNESRPGEKTREPEQPPKEEKRRKPSRLEEVKRNTMANDRVSMQGGVKMSDTDPSLNVKSSVFGNYDREFVDAVQQEWENLLNRNGVVRKAGKVVLEFRLNYKGEISDMKVIENTAGEILGVICELAIRHPSPYRTWPMEMRRELNSDYREVRFTFYYLSG
jgi:hypothetical protein